MTLTMWTVWALKAPFRALFALGVGLWVALAAGVGACRTVWAETR